MADRIRFAPAVADDVRDAVRAALAAGPAEADRFSEYARGVKTFYRVASPAGELFIKRRRFRGLWQRLGRTVRRTKAEIEFAHLAELARRGVPCPEPLAVARRVGPLLVRESLLVERFVPDAAPLGRSLLEQSEDRAALIDRLVELMKTLRDRGVVHRDLHWDNILVQRAATGPRLLLLDPLHVRFLSPSAKGRAAREARQAVTDSAVWMLAFMIRQGAPDDVVIAFLDRACGADVLSPADRDALVARARTIAARLG